MDRSARILLAGSLLTAGIATALLFRHPATEVRTSELGPMAPPAGPGERAERPQDGPIVRIEDRRRDPVPAPSPAGPPALVEPMDPGTRPPELDAASWPQLKGNAAARSVPRGEATTPRTHTIVDGDTLPDLARKYLGDPQRFLEIYEANLDRLPSPDLLPIGAELKIPPKINRGHSRQPSVPGLVPVPRSSASEPG